MNAKVVAHESSFSVLSVSIERVGCGGGSKVFQLLQI
jgi:hypothetical protein